MQTSLSAILAEANSADPYVRRMRPTFGYLMAITWAAQMLGLAYVMIFQTEKAPAVLDGMEALSTIWAVGLSVLGIYVYKRSEEKKVSNFSTPVKTKTETKTETPPAMEVKPTTNITPTQPAKTKFND